MALAASPARAPSADEQRLYDEGLRAFQAGDARAAEKAWKAGYAVAHDPAFLVHIGEAQEKAGAPAEAVDTYRRYLREAPDAADRADIEQRLARLAPDGGPSPSPRAGRDPPPDETPGEFGATPPTPSLTRPRRPPARRGRGTARRHRASGRRGAAGGQRLEPLQHHRGRERVGRRRACWRRRAVRRRGRLRRGDVNRLVNLPRPTAARRSGIRRSPPSTSRRWRTAPRHDRYAKIALAASAVAAAVSVTFFVLDAKLGVTPAVAIAPDGRASSRRGAVNGVSRRALLLAVLGAAGRSPAAIHPSNVPARSPARMTASVPPGSAARLTALPPRRRSGDSRHPVADRRRRCWRRRLGQRRGRRRFRRRRRRLLTARRAPPITGYRNSGTRYSTAERRQKESRRMTNHGASLLCACCRCKSSRRSDPAEPRSCRRAPRYSPGTSSRRWSPAANRERARADVRDHLVHRVDDIAGVQATWYACGALEPKRPPPPSWTAGLASPARLRRRR